MATMTRRSFIGTLGATAVAAAGARTALATGASASADAAERHAQIMPDEEIVAATGWTGTPANIEKLGGSTMPLEALNIYRRRYVDTKGEVTLADGRTIPAVYNKVRALINTYGIGIGDSPDASQMADNTFDDLMEAMTEDDAQAFLDMPWGREFRPLEFCMETGRSLEECTDVCERLAKAGYLFRIESSAGNYYHHMPFYQGFSEVRYIMKIGQEPSFNIGFLGDDWDFDRKNVGSSVIFTIPCDKDVVTDNQILPYDDIETIIESQDTFAIAPCACRYRALMKGVANGEVESEGIPSLDDLKSGEWEDWFSPLSGRRIETCLHMGDEAKYHIASGNARQITKEDALRYMKRSRDDGFILQKLFTKGSQTVCSCDRDTCLCMWEFNYFGGDATKIPSFDQTRSHYELEVDLDKCVKCGTCVDRCPMRVVHMDEETGYPTIGDPEVGPLCFRCGQCAYVCPAGARTLVPRPTDELLEQPETIIDDHNMKAAYRFEHGLIG